MTTATDLDMAVGIKHRLFLKIDSFEPILWQRYRVGEDGYDTPGYYPITSDCCGAWFFDEYITTENCIDQSGNNNPAVPSESPPGIYYGIIGKSRTFGGPNQYMTVSRSPVLDRQAFTISVRANYSGDGTRNRPALVQHVRRAGISWELGLGSNDQKPTARFFFDDDTSLEIVGADDIIPGNHLWTLTWDGGNAALWINNICVASGSAPGKTLHYEDGGMLIGNSLVDFATLGWEGRIDAIAYYGTVKNPTWINRAYRAMCYSRSGLECLRPPAEEFSDGLDVAEQVVQPSSMSIAIDNIDDPADRAKKYFARQFAVGACATDTTLTTWLRRPNSDEKYLSANAIDIYVRSVATWPQVGIGYLGREAFEYATRNTDTIDYFGGCIKGMWPCVGNAQEKYGYTYSYSTDEQLETENLQVSPRPYSWVGRRVALYVVTWDDATGYWNAEGDAVCLWCGRLTDSVIYSATEACWKLSCEHISKDFETEICRELPQSNLRKIDFVATTNEWSRGITLRVEYRFEGFGAHMRDYWCTFNMWGEYDNSDKFVDALVAAINDESNWRLQYDGARKPRRWIDIPLGGEWAPIEDFFAYRDGTDPGRIALNFGVVNLNEIAAEITPVKGHPVNAEFFPWIYSVLGWDVRPPYLKRAAVSEKLNESQQKVAIVCAWELGDVADVWLPINSAAGYLNISDATSFLTNQGDYNYPTAFVGVDNAYGLDGHKSSAIIAIHAQNENKLDQTPPYYVPWLAQVNKGLSYIRVSAKESDENAVVTQVFAPACVYNDKAPSGGAGRRGPFTALLYSLLSTGTSEYNHAIHDKLPLTFSVGMQADLIDIESFLAADASVQSGAGTEVADRTGYVITKPIKWIDLFKREGKLFGYFLTWQNGKFFLRSATQTSSDEWIETLDDSNNATTVEIPEYAMSINTVLNQWRFKIDYNRDTDKYGPELVINDTGSQSGLGAIKSVVVEHPGIYATSQGAKAIGALALVVGNGVGLYRFPWPVITISLASKMINRVFVGDIVRWFSSRHPDPFGSGTMVTDCRALVINKTWSCERWAGSATLLLRPGENEKIPWAYSALTNIDEINGGWDPDKLMMHVLPHAFGLAWGKCDAVRILPNDRVNIIERAPYPDPTMPLKWLNVTVASRSDAAVYFPAGTTFSAWDPKKQYVIMPADYRDCADWQRGTNAHQADSLSTQLGSSDRPRMWN